MSEDERDIDVELDDGDLGGMDDEGGSLAGDDGIPENKRCDIRVLSNSRLHLPFSVLCTMQWKGKGETRSRTASEDYRCHVASAPPVKRFHV